MSDTGENPVHSDDPASELAPDEPHTPMWLTLLGAALALLAVIYFVASRPAGKTTEELRGAGAPAASAAASASADAPAPPAPAAPAPPPGE